MYRFTNGAWGSPQTLTSTATAGANFGYSVALSADGNTAIVGGPQSSGNAGYAAVYRFTGGSWGSAQTLTSTAGATASFGYSVALSADGNTAIVGALNASTNAGYAAVYRFTGGSWGSAQTLTSTADSSAEFGTSVSISADGNTALVGATLHSTSTGYAAVYRFTGGSWGSAQTLTSTAGAGALFGNSVILSADGNTALVGAPYASSNAGYAAVYRFTGGSWGSAQTLPSTAGPSAYFGESVFISADGNTAIVGGSNGNGGNGYAAVYRFTGGSWGSASSITSTTGAGSSFGGAVSISADGNTAFIGAPTTSSNDGYAAVFLLNPKFLINNTFSVYNGFVGIGTKTPTANLHVLGDVFANTLTLTGTVGHTTLLVTGGSKFYFDDSVTAQILPSTAGAGATSFGYSVALSADGTTAIVGAPDASTSDGYAAVYRFTNGAWGSPQTLTSTAGATANFGCSVALSADGNTALVGATIAGATNDGYAAVYQFTNGAWGSAQTLTSTATTGSRFGYSVSISADGNTALVGAPSTLSTAGYAAVYRFTGGSWGSAQTLTSTASRGFGTSVSISADGNTALVGAGF